MNQTNVQQQFPLRACPTCDGRATQLLYRQQFAQFSEGSLHDGYDVVACDRCGCCYADDIPGQEVFDRYYREMSKYEQPVTAGKINDYDLKRFEDTVGKIVPTLQSGNPRILEIGCATGALLGLLKTTGQQEVMGLDPSPGCCRIAGQTYGVATRCGTLSDNLIPDGSVDYLILIGVLEHLRDLAVAVQKLRTTLAPGGRIFITVPDASKYAAGDDAPFQEFSVEHINFFGPQSLSNLMAAHGFKTIHCEQAEIRPNFRTMTPVIHACFEKLAVVPVKPSLPFDADTVRGLKLYIDRSGTENDSIQPRLEELAESGRAVSVWGAGAHTLRLLATSALGRANLQAIVDSNPLYQGKTVNGIPILKPAALSELPGAIVISTRVFQKEIHNQIVNGLKLKNEVITLYQITDTRN